MDDLSNITGTVQSDINQTLALANRGPSFPDTSEQDARMAAGRAQAQTSESEYEAAARGSSDLADTEAQKLQQYSDQLDQMMQRYPSSQVFNAAALNAAPIIGIMSALGGKAAGLTGQNMLGALNGMMQGLNEGSADNYQKALTKWKQELDNYKERHQQQLEIYEVMQDAYKSRADAAQKARDFALQMTNDAWTEKEANKKDAIDIWKARGSMVMNADKLTMALDKLGMQMQMQNYKIGQMNPMNDPLVRKLDAKITQMEVPIQGSRGGPVYFQRLQDMLQQFPGAAQMSPQEQEALVTDIAGQMKSGAMSLRMQGAEASTVGRREGNLGPALVALDGDPNHPETPGLYDQLLEVAKKVNFGDAKTASQIKLAMQRKVVANPDIAEYANILRDVRAEQSVAYSKTGQVTDQSRKAADEAFPDVSSYQELERLVQRAKKANAAVKSGNTAFSEALESGIGLDEAYDIHVARGGGAQQDKFTVGKTYRDGNGNTAVYLGNGKWQ